MEQEKTDDEYLEQYLLLCRRIYERHVREGTWPTEEEWEEREKNARSGSSAEM